MSAVFGHIETLPEWEDIDLLTRAHAVMEELRAAQDAATHALREAEQEQVDAKRAEQEAEAARALEIEEEEKERILRITEDEEDRRRQEAEEQAAERAAAAAAAAAAARKEAEDKQKRSGALRAPPPAPVQTTPVDTSPAAALSAALSATPARTPGWAAVRVAQAALRADLTHVHRRFQYMVEGERWHPALASHSVLHALRLERAAAAATAKGQPLHSTAQTVQGKRSSALVLDAATAATSQALAPHVPLTPQQQAREWGVDPHTSSLSALHNVASRQLNLRFVPLHYVPRRFLPLATGAGATAGAPASTTASAASGASAAAAASSLPAASAAPASASSSSSSSASAAGGSATAANSTNSSGTGGGGGSQANSSSGLWAGAHATAAITARPKRSQSRSSLIASALSPTGLLVVGGANPSVPPAASSSSASSSAPAPPPPPALSALSALREEGDSKHPQHSPSPPLQPFVEAPSPPHSPALTPTPPAGPAPPSASLDAASASGGGAAAAAAEDVPAAEHDLTPFPADGMCRSAYRGRVSKAVLSEPFMFAGLVHYTKVLRAACCVLRVEL